jgi:hypothetical protein
MITSPAFEILRRYYPCDQQTEEFILKRINGSVNQNDLVQIVENGISGQFGKVYKADPQTVLGWVDEWRKSSKNGLRNDLSLLNPFTRITDPNYPTGIYSWYNEVNKCYWAHLKGVTENNFHPDIYDRLVMDGKLKIRDMNEHKVSDSELDVMKAKQITAKMYFIEMQKRNVQNIYYVQ